MDTNENFKYYLIIIIGLRYNIKYYKIYYDKNEALLKYDDIFNQKNMIGKDFRGLNIPTGVSILSGFNNDYGIINLIGFNNICNGKLFVGFTDKSHNNIITIIDGQLDETILRYKKKIEFQIHDIIDLKK